LAGPLIATWFCVRGCIGLLRARHFWEKRRRQPAPAVRSDAGDLDLDTPRTVGRGVLFRVKEKTLLFQVDATSVLGKTLIRVREIPNLNIAAAFA